MPYVYSTITNPTSYVDYGSIDPNSGHAIIRKRVNIAGGHGVAIANRGMAQGNIHTPRGVATEVSESDLEFLLQNREFKRHMAAGFVTVDTKQVDPAKRAADMAEKDGSAPMTEADFEKSDQSSDEAPIFKSKGKK